MKILKLKDLLATSEFLSAYLKCKYKSFIWVPIFVFIALIILINFAAFLIDLVNLYKINNILYLNIRSGIICGIICVLGLIYKRMDFKNNTLVVNIINDIGITNLNIVENIMIGEETTIKGYDFTVIFSCNEAYLAFQEDITGEENLFKEVSYNECLDECKNIINSHINKLIETKSKEQKNLDSWKLGV